MTPRMTDVLRDQIKGEYSGEWGELKRLSEKFNLSEATISLVVNGHRG